MSLFFPVKRATLLIPSGPAHDPDRKHLFILLTDPVTQEQLVLIVSISSIKHGQRYDDSCVLNPGEHPFIKRPSFVDYRRARIIEVQKLVTGVNQKLFQPCGTVSESVYAYVCQGLLKSPFVSPKIKKFFTDVATK
ncbi:MAG: hypothetical protein CMI12_15355 [Oceanospirillum sp.]|nr:hypothetical protein [Oceanospirillum sp.]